MDCPSSIRPANWTRSFSKSGGTERRLPITTVAAFRDMEGEVCDLDRMGEIAQNLIMNCAAREDSFHDLELATFAVWQLAKMAKEFRANYQKRWHGELVGVS
jgi:hypothetical protein